VERALQRGPEPPDVFDFLNACAASAPPTEREQREVEVQRAVKDSKRSAPALRRKLLQARERKRTLQAEEAQLRERGVRLGRDVGGVGAGTSGSNQASMGQQLLAQDQGRLTRIARDVAALVGEERQLERLLGQRSEGKKMFKF
jgi:hypothetical protein